MHVDDSTDWQVESGLRTAVFISATSSELGVCRKILGDVLLRAGVFPVVQEYFAPDRRSVEDLLLEKILASDAVICLIGRCFGAAPPGGSRSYTQMEYDIAIKYGKPCYVFVSSAEFVGESDLAEPEENRRAQEVFRDGILSGSHRYDLFSSIEHLRELAVATLGPLKANAGSRAITYLHMPPAPSAFVGRTDEIHDVRSAIQEPTPGAIVILGMGGQGKTTLLAQALKSGKGLPFSAGLWASTQQGGFTFPDFVDAALSEFLRDRFVKAHCPRVDSRVQRLLLVLQSRPTLIVIDAVERWLEGWLKPAESVELGDESQRRGGFEGLDDFLRQVSALDNGSHVILTSRALPAALDALACAILPVLPSGAKPVAGLGGLSPKDAVSLLKELGVVAPEEKLLSVAQSLVCHPLTLTSFAKVAQRIGANWESLLLQRAHDPTRAFWHLMEEVRRRLPDSQTSERVMQVIAQLPEGASLALIDHLMGKNPGETLPYVLALADWNLLIWDREASVARLHSLVADFFDQTLDDPGRRELHLRSADWYEEQAQLAGDAVAGAGLMSHAFLHALKSRDTRRALLIMFANPESGSCLLTRLLVAGHLWECAEYLTELVRHTTGLDKVRCILAKAQMLNSLDLADRCLDEVRVAQALVVLHGGTLVESKELLLAKCQGTEGIIHLETAYASDALACFDRAVSSYRAARQSGESPGIDYPITLTNRALARSCLGDWDGARRDYLHALNEFGPGASETEVGPLVMTARVRLASLRFLEGDQTSSLDAIEGAIAEAEEALVWQKNPRTFVGMLTTLGVCQLNAGLPDAALTTADRAMECLHRIGAASNPGMVARMAQASTLRTQALLKLGRIDEAAESGHLAVSYYEDLIQRGAEQYSGQLASALFARSESRFGQGASSDAAFDLLRAVRLSRDFLARWFGQCDIGPVFFSNGLRALGYIPTDMVAERRQVLIAISECIELAGGASPGLAEMSKLRATIRSNWEYLFECAEACGVFLGTVLE